MNKEEIKHLENFIVDNRDLERLESLIAQFNIFESVGAVRQELRHSDFLSFLLDPSSNHGLSDLFFKSILKQVLISADEPPLSAIDVDIANMRDVEIRREWNNIDILAISPGTQIVCAIENKIDTSEHSNQLPRYRNFIFDNFKDYQKILIYLTPEGEAPSDNNWIPYSYNEISGLLEKLCSTHKSSMGYDIHILITHYVTMLRRHIVSESEIAELCRKIYSHHKKALDLIYEHKPDLQSDLADFLEELVKSSESAGISLDVSSKTYIRFCANSWDQYPAQLLGNEWTSTKRILLFEFQNTAKSLVLKLIIGPGDKHAREMIYNIASQHSLSFPGRSSKLYQKFTQIYKREYLKSKDYDDSNMDDLKSKINRRWKKFLEEDFKEIMGKMIFPELSSE